MGFMQTGVGGSLEALAIDDEILRYIAWSLEERPADAAAMDVDAVKQAVSTSAGFLGLRQTRSYLRTESVQRKLAHSGALSLAEWSAGGHDLLGRARDVVDAALAQPPLGLDAAVIGAASDTLVETAEHMGVEPPDLPLILESFRDLSRAAVG